MADLIVGLYEDWLWLDARIEHISGEIEKIAQSQVSCQRLMSVPGIGPMISIAMVAAIGDGEAFERAEILALGWGLSEISCAGHDDGKEGDIAWHDAKHPTIPDEVLDQLLAGADPQDGLRQGRPARRAEEGAGRAGAERRDGPSSRRRRGQREQPQRLWPQDGADRHRQDRDRGAARPAATFDPQLIAKYQRRFPGFDDKIVSMYARGMSAREIQGHLRDLYGIDVSPDLISAVTDAVLDEIADWQNRPLEPVYPLVFFDALRVKVRDEGMVRNKAVYIALGVRADGTKEILGLWIEQNEGAKFWLRVMNELKNRGVEDVLIAVVDGLKGFPDAITAVFPQAQVQTCIVHLICATPSTSSPTRTARRSPRR